MTIGRCTPSPEKAYHFQIVSKYIRDKNNLFQKKYFSLFFHNEQHMYGYNPSYANEIGKKLGFKYSRHIQDSDIHVIKFMPIAQFSKIKIM